MSTLSTPQQNPKQEEPDRNLAMELVRVTEAAAMAAGRAPPGDPVQASMQVWAAAHGGAALMISKPFLPWGDRHEFANRALASAALGLAGVEAFTGPPVAEQVARWRAEQAPTPPGIE